MQSTLSPGHKAVVCRSEGRVQAMWLGASARQSRITQGVPAIQRPRAFCCPSEGRGPMVIEDLGSPARSCLPADLMMGRAIVHSTCSWLHFPRHHSLYPLHY